MNTTPGKEPNGVSTGGPLHNDSAAKETANKSDDTWRGDPLETYSDWNIEVICEKSVASAHDCVLVGKDGAEEKSTDINNEKPASSMDSVDTYHIHRFVLTHGKRKSLYFDKMFRNQPNENFNKFFSRSTILKFEQPLAAEVFPVVLDFLYSEGSEPLDIATETATALLYLGQYLEIQELVEAAMHYIILEYKIFL